MHCPVELNPAATQPPTHQKKSFRISFSPKRDPPRSQVINLVFQIAKQIEGTKTLKSSNFLQNRIWHCDSEFLGWLILSHQFLLHDDDDDDDDRDFHMGLFWVFFFFHFNAQWTGQVFFLGLSHYKSISTGTQYVALHWKPCMICSSHMIRASLKILSMHAHSCKPLLE
jgi:hypothetical protein